MLPDADRRPITRTTVQRVLQFSKPYRPRVALTVPAIMVVSMIGLVNPFFRKPVIDDAIPNRDLGCLYLFVGLTVALPITTGSARSWPPT